MMLMVLGRASEKENLQDQNHLKQKLTQLSRKRNQDGHHKQLLSKPRHPQKVMDNHSNVTCVVLHMSQIPLGEVTAPKPQPTNPVLDTSLTLIQEGH